MNLQEFLKSNPEANAEFEASLQTAKQEGIDSVNATFENDRKRIANILELSGVKLPDSTIEAIENNIDEGEFAKAELKRQKEIRNDVQKDSIFSNIRIDSAQTPKEQDPQVDNFEAQLEKAANELKNGGKK